MSSREAIDLEGLLRRALAPVEPPTELAERLESKLTELTTAAVGELEGWELGSMRDPRNWARPAAAAAVGVTAGSALVLLRTRRRAERRRKSGLGGLDLAGRTLRDLREEARKLLP